ncbi:hypothetical protein LAUMK7_05529 [Mycobacterium kansasii]|nr:hypothetical protein LAUMK7_05529 [Mycobacterium kansasii]
MRIRASKRGLVAGVRQLVAGPGAGVTNIWAVFGISPGTSVVVWAVPWRPAAPSCAGLAIATGTMVATRCAQLRWACDRHGNDGGDPLRPAALGLRSPRERWWRPAAPSCAGLAIATGTMVATRCAQLRWACDRHGNDGGDPLRPAALGLRSPRERWWRPAAPSSEPTALGLRSPRERWWRPAAPSVEPTELGLRSPRERWWRPAAPSCAGLAIATGTMVASRCAQLRWACDRHGAVTLTFPAA